MADIPDSRLMRDVEEFATTHGLTDIVALLRKGARVAKDPASFESVQDITEDEVQAIRNEVLHKWRHPRALYYTIALCSIGAAVQ